MCGYSKLVNLSIITKESSTCIDLVFATSPNLIRETGVELSISEKCDHNLIYGIIDLRSLFCHLIWDRFETIKMLM